MSFWKQWFGKVGGSAAGESQPGCCVIDGNAWINVRGSGRADPRDMIAALQRMGRWSQREKLRVEAVFDGEPLRKAGDGESFAGVQVWFAKGRPQVVELLRERAKAASREGFDVVWSVSDVDWAREAIALGAGCIRPATLRKAMEGAGGDDRGDRGDRSGSPRRRRGGNRRARPTDGGAKPKKSDEEPPARDTVHSLLDVVD